MDVDSFKFADRIATALESIAASLVSLANEHGSSSPRIAPDPRYGTPPFKKKTVELPRNQP